MGVPQHIGAYLGPIIDGRPMASPQEERLAVLLAQVRDSLCPDAQLERQVEIDGGRYVVDFLVTFPGGLRLAVECDGYTFHWENRRSIDYGCRRDRWLLSRGLIPVHYTSGEIDRSAARCAVSVFRLAERMGEVMEGRGGGDQ